MTALLKAPHPPSAVESEAADCLTEIFRDTVNLAIWQRRLDAPLHAFAEAVLAHSDSLERFISVGPGESAHELLPAWAADLPGASAFLADLDHLIEMFRCLFEPAAVGVRLHALQRPMCPRFHTDRVPVRLLSTYLGPGTEWLPESCVVRNRDTGRLPDQTASAAQIRHVPTGAVALLKGEAWIGNEGHGVVHRSPCGRGDPRLLIGLDWLSE
ncbi:DUF1826 domain-containing protein [Marinobacter xestospongiae]|uniref:DUF1826 domain-containing protein n=1 Tax=Marinobacter xestospongiae TaxID=994319 RepID=A0ABU3VY74_9GAMM|nr:DUF1826 domain-containing protein [Marinobacter xestospongiae]MDV2079219.1 DUF1826 domain-containing protein [Marinobacter xestospongiae]